MTVSLNVAVGPVIDQVILLFPTLLSLVLAALPIIVAMAFIGLMIGFFDGVLAKIRL